MHKYLRSMVVACVGLLLFAAGGCNMERLYEDDQEMEGPTTDMANPEGVDLPDIRIADAKEVDLVEQVLFHRAMYRRTLEALRDYYDRHGYTDKRRWANQELRELDRVQAFKYILSAEIPTSELRPESAVASADKLYREAMELMKEGGHGTPIFYRNDKMITAARKLQQLVENYPNSDKIDDAAFYLGEIYKEYFKDQERIAVQWYHRAYTWDPKTPYPARFQEAVVYDFRLHDRDRALELYNEVLKIETADESNVKFANRRIYELTDQRDRLADPSLDRRDPAGLYRPEYETTPPPTTREPGQEREPANANETNYRHYREG